VNSDSECALLVRLSTAVTYDESLNQKVTEGDSVIMHCGPKVNASDTYFWIKDFNYFGPHLPMNPRLQVCMTTVKILVNSRPYSMRTRVCLYYVTVLRLSSVVCMECIVGKRCVQEQKLLLTAYRQS